MIATLLPGVLLATAATRIADALNELHNRQAVAHTPLERLAAYQRWASEQARILSYTVTSESLDHLVTSPRYVLLQGIDPSRHQALAALLDLEVHQRTMVLTAARDELHAAASAWQDVRHVVVPDTNLLLHDRHDVAHLPWWALADTSSDEVDVVIPAVVIEELDRRKDGPGDKPAGPQATESTRSRARRSLRLLQESFDDPMATATLVPAALPAHAAVRWRLLLDPPVHQPLPRADAELVARAAHVRDLSGARVTIASFDTLMGLRARAEGLCSVTPDVDFSSWPDEGTRRR